MHDPREGVTPQGTIRTGARRQAVSPVHEPVLRAAVDAVAGRCALYLYGSVATGTASVPTSDVDLLSIGLTAAEARRIAGSLSARFRDVCRELSIGPAGWDQLDEDGDEAYGLRVFLRHYAVHLHGPDPAASLPAFPADVRAARGFNGDLARHVGRWMTALEQGEDPARLGTRVARKTLLAVAGLVSVRDGTWTTDRRSAAGRWGQLEPQTSVESLVAWLDLPPTDPAAVQAALAGPVAAVTEAFAAEIGRWDV
ncbi:nucleotidyltransferase domain-containing protein [Egicoccus halophilus]|uniref:Nucleotidyltransferase domain-containing protein n=1 Tax=Egicoccus halophilus TaxID=1670830 RepID=A0A8J3A6L8_9ACTN|nr:nucleotidyltransferase domain-containing protein [Egicoccus halophilus]GGI02568.1 hypothetical protein GCM10011354_00800 [Egicoccus halophilus]